MKIMILEDDKRITNALRLRLRKAGYDVVTAEDAIMAAGVAVRECPDLVILDISVPGGNGFLVGERLQQLDAIAGVPLIFLTASRKPGLRERAEELGAVAFFEKPYDAAELLAKIEDTLADVVVEA